MDTSAAFDQFKTQCTARGYITEPTPGGDDVWSGGDDVWSGVCDDATLLRFLRARGYNVQAALEQYEKTRAWRKDNHLFELYDKIDVQDYDATRKMYTHWTGRRDRHGNPICYFDIAALTSTVMAEYASSCAARTTVASAAEPESMLRLFCTYENLTRFLFPLCSAMQPPTDPPTLISSCTCIVDISGVGLLQFLRLRTHMQAASALATAYYPETLGRTYIVGAPSFFPSIWSWITRFFDQNTVDKIRIVPQGDVAATLAESIDPSSIPRKYGGNHDFEFGMSPDLDPEIRDTVQWMHGSGKDDQGLPIGPMRWIEDKQGESIALAVGTELGQPRRLQVLSLS